MMAATVSSCGLIKVGPNTTPRFATVIRFLLACFETLFEKNWRKKQEMGYEKFPLLLETAVYKWKHYISLIYVLEVCFVQSFFK